VSKAPRCDRSYPDLCIPPFDDVTCGDRRPNRNFTVKPPDPYRLDPDQDGIGCERTR
jgi:micrococcal nuclease